MPRPSRKAASSKSSAGGVSLKIATPSRSPATKAGILRTLTATPRTISSGPPQNFGEKPFKPRVVGAQPGAPFDRLRMTHNVERYLSESKPTWNNEKKNAVVPIASAAPATTCMIVCALR